MPPAIETTVKTNVIKQWLSGDSRDKIAVDNDIGAGTVSNIINEWKKGVEESAYRHHHNHNSNSIKVDQQISQANVCTGAAPADSEEMESTQTESQETEEAASAPTICLNNANNTANIHG